jgi:hypothetical protein
MKDKIFNKAKEYLRANNETVEDWDGFCGSLADEVVGDGKMLYVEGDIAWRYHMVPLIDGLVHDAWCEGEHAREVADWLRTMFGNAVIELSRSGETIYEGPADKFKEAFKDLGKVKV